MTRLQATPSRAAGPSPDGACSESTWLYGRLTARLQRDVPDRLVSLGLFRNRQPSDLPLHVVLAVTERRVYVEERSLSWAVSVWLDDGRHFELQAKRVGANHVNGEAVRALTGP
jgi:hypothetical protein